MSQKTKYILSIILGFVLVFAIGIGSIKLFKAKRSKAPEDGVISNGSAIPGVSDEVKKRDLEAKQAGDFDVPAEQGSSQIDFTTLPADIQLLLKTPENANVYSVVYIDGSKGYRIEQDSANGLQKLTVDWRTILQTHKYLVSGKSSTEQTFYSAKVGTWKVVVVLSKLTNTSTGQTIRVIHAAP